MTAVQQVFSDLEKLHPQLFNVYTTEGKEFVNHFHKYLAVEKEKLEQFYNHGQWAVIENGHGECFEDYYNRTFKSE